jgi:hypothetical protein
MAGRPISATRSICMPIVASIQYSTGVAKADAPLGACVRAPFCAPLCALSKAK